MDFTLLLLGGSQLPFPIETGCEPHRGGQSTQLPFHFFPDPDIGSTPNASGVQKQEAVSPTEG